jgi:hypothetical protein
MQVEEGTLKRCGGCLHSEHTGTRTKIHGRSYETTTTSTGRLVDFFTPSFPALAMNHVFVIGNCLARRDRVCFKIRGESSTKLSVRFGYLFTKPRCQFLLSVELRRANESTHQFKDRVFFSSTKQRNSRLGLRPWKNHASGRSHHAQPLPPHDRGRNR